MVSIAKFPQIMGGDKGTGIYALIPIKLSWAGWQ